MIVMPCGCLRADNIGQVCRETGLWELHFAAHKMEPSANDLSQSPRSDGSNLAGSRISKNCNRPNDGPDHGGSGAE